MKRFCKILALCVISACCAVGFAACGGNNAVESSEIDGKLLEIYNTYVAYAEENETIPKTYEEWLALVKGEKGEQGQQGESGVGVADVIINESGDLIITLTNGNEINAGKIKEIHPHAIQVREITEKEPTCVATGIKYVYCEECGEVIKTIIMDNIPHSYVRRVVSPACTSQGYTEYICEYCGDGYVDDYVDALGHDYLSEIIAPACTKQGYTKHTCLRCGDWYNNDYIDALGHDYDAETTAPTCTEQGYTTYTCKRCGDVYVGNYVDAHHKYVNGVCTVCGAQYGEVCEHKLYYDYWLNLADYGACDGKVHLTTCADCGQYLEISFRTDEYKCDFDFRAAQKAIYDKDGNIIGATLSVTCSKCGLQAHEEVTRTRVAGETCLYYGTGEGYIDMPNGEVINIGYEKIFASHKTTAERQKEDLSGKDFCGGYVCERYCQDCGEISGCYFNVSCKWGNYEETDNGFTYKCSNCGATYLYSKYYSEKDANCVCTRTIIIALINADGEEISRIEDVSRAFHHGEGIPYYEFFNGGTNCNDGVEIRYICKDCGRWTGSSQSYYNHSSTDIVSREIDLSEAGLCGGYINEKYCTLCGTDLGTVKDYLCVWEYKGEDEDGHSVYQCPECNALRIYYEESEELENGKNLVSCVEVIYNSKGQEVYRGERKQTRDN
ncbi:MAG: hypothetical protein J5911_05790 [Clostridia bacterium]|nr:hypothetical protein [Clostridia bacterium]